MVKDIDDSAKVLLDNAYLEASQNENTERNGSDETENDEMVWILKSLVLQIFSQN